MTFFQADHLYREIDKGPGRTVRLFWVQPVQVSGPLQTVMYYSPSGAAVRALLDSAFNSATPYTTIVTMVAYTIVFSFLAIRYFRWE